MIEEPPIKHCPVCGFSSRELVKSLRMGCSSCYDRFGDELTTFLPRLHRGSTHVGKSPRTARPMSARLAGELRDVEILLSSRSGEKGTDELLERWKQIALQIEKLTQDAAEEDENS